MILCKNCGVELEPDMKICPLCEEPVVPGTYTKENKLKKEKGGVKTYRDFETRTLSKPQRKAVWELISIILILLVIATGLINYIINRQISWSEYPIAICLIIFSYVSSFTYLNRRREAQLLFSFIASSFFILILDLITGGVDWALQLGIPLLFSANFIFIGLMATVRMSRQRGVNVIAYYFMAVPLLCFCIEIISDLYFRNTINFFWSLIVGACLIPVALVLLFMHYKLKKGQDLNKTFHI